MMIPEQYGTHTPLELLEAAASGKVGFDRRLARALVEAGERTVEDVLRFDAESSEACRVDLRGPLLAVLRIIGSPRALPFYLKQLRTAAELDEELPEDAEAAVRALGGEAIEPLLKLYEELGEEAGGEIAYLLVTLGHRDPRILELLEARMAFDPLDALLLMQIYRDPAARPIVERFLADMEVSGISDSLLKEEGEETLKRLSEPPEEFPAMGDPWDAFPETAPPVFSVLDPDEREEFLESPLEEHRVEAAQSYFNRRLSARVESKLLSMARSDPSVRVRATCWEVLGSGTESAEVVAELKRRLADEGAPVEERCGAMAGLASEAGDEDVLPFVMRFAADPATRPKAVETMWRSAHRGFRDLIPAFLDDPNREVRRNAILAVGYLGMTPYLDRLRRFLSDDELREDALYAYALAMPGETTPGRVRGMYRKIDEVAGGLSAVEDAVVKAALDYRLKREGHAPQFGVEAEEEEPEAWAEGAEGAHSPAAASKVGRNEPCPCGSGKKYKKCCGA